MFKCCNCENVFSEPKIGFESRGEFWGAPAYEKWYYCPHCECDEFDEYVEDEDDEE